MNFVRRQSIQLSLVRAWRRAIAASESYNPSVTHYRPTEGLLRGNPAWQDRTQSRVVRINGRSGSPFGNGELIKNDTRIAEAIDLDLATEEFARLCQGKERSVWAFALAKILKTICSDPKECQPFDEAMRRLVNDVGNRSRTQQEETYYRAIDDQYCETGYGVAEYRYTDYPCRVGEMKSTVSVNWPFSQT